MNKIFKVVWSKARGCYVVASEFAKSHTKSGRAVKAVAMAVAAALTLGVNGMAMAVDVISGTGEGVAVGTDSETLKDTDTAVGNGATADGTHYDSEHGYLYEKPNDWNEEKDGKFNTGGTVAIGKGAFAKGQSSLALGSYSRAENIATAIGSGAEATGEFSVAVGRYSISSGNLAVAFGDKAYAKAKGSVALGHLSTVDEDADLAISVGLSSGAYGEQSQVIGNNAYSSKSAFRGVALGSYAGVFASSAVAVGAYADAERAASLSLGYKSNAYGERSVAVGHEAGSGGAYSIAIGDNAITGIREKVLKEGSDVTDGGFWFENEDGTISSGYKYTYEPEYAIAVGANANAKTNDSIALGQNAVAGSDDGENEDAMALGHGARAFGDSSIALGLDSKASEDAKNSISLGTLSKANAEQAISIGAYSEAAKVNSVALGKTAKALGTSSIASGTEAKAYDDYTIAIGWKAKAGSESDRTTDNQYASAMGYQAKAYGMSSTALGYNAIANDKDTISVGTSSKAYGNSSMAEGNQAEAYGYGSVALGHLTIAGDGNENATTMYAIAVGDRAHATDVYSIAVGYTSRATGDDSIAQGRRAVAFDDNTIAIGYDAQAGSGTVDWSDKNNPKITNNKQTDAQYATAIGYSAKAYSENSLALGHSAEVDNNAVQALAMGSGAHAYGAKNVVLGAGSNDGSSTGVVVGGYDTSYTGNEYVFTTSDGNPALKVMVSDFAGIGADVIGTVSVGSEGQTRTITNVAAGMIAEGSTDAINGSQLYAVADALNTKVDNLPEQKHTVNGNDKKADAPVVNSGQYVGGNLLIKADQDENTGDITYDISLNNKLDLGKDGSIKFGDKTIIKDNSIQVWDTTINNDGLTINNGPSFTKTEINAGGNVIHNAGTTVGGEQNKYDVVNVDYLQQYVGKNSHAHTVNGADNNGVGMAAGETYNTDGNLLIKAEKDKDGNILSYDISMNNNLDLGSSGSIKFGDKTIIKDNSIQVGDTYIDNSSVKISGTTVGNTTYGDIVIKQGDVSYGDNIITNVGTTTGGEGHKHDVVNVEYLENYVSGDGNTDTHIEAGKYKVGDDNSVSMDIIDQKGNTTGTVTITDVAKASDVGDINKFHTDVLNKDGSTTTVVDAINNIDNRVTKVEGDIVDIKKDITKVAGQHTEVTVNGGTKAPSDGSYADGNLQLKVDEVDGKKTYDIKMNNKLDLGPDGSVTIGDTKIDNSSVTTNNVNVKNKLQVGDKITINGDDNSVNIGSTTITENKFDMGNTHITNNNVTTNEVTTGNTTVNNNGLTIKGDTEEKNITINQNNVSVGGNQIHNVAPGTAGTDAVNKDQLDKVAQNVTNNSVQINKLGSRVDKVGAGAAALAALHPLDFDPDDKFYLSAGYGNYRGENAVAVGAFYQPNDDTLFSVSSTVGNDDDMINAGVTWRFGQSSNQSRSKKAMAKEIIELRTRLASLEAMIYSMAGAGLDLEKSKLFPDTPENHWAYDYVAVVAGNGILEGYPDGYFDGERPMTRYEMAAVVYRLLQKGVQVDNRMVQEFAPELARVRVDTLTHYNDGTPNIQRVRVIEGRG